jgi:CheY-like chemotaxis protein
MPFMSGMKVLELIRQHEQMANVPVIMYSTSVSTYDAQPFIASGAAGFLEKAVDVDDDLT